MAVQIMRRQFSVHDYHRMRLAGILTEDDRVELIDGEVREMSPIGPQHAAIVKRLIAILNRSVPNTVILSVQDPIQLSDYSEPQPDVALLQARDDFYATAHPTADDVRLIIEVADTSVEYDRDEKLPRYAHAGIPEVWLIDVRLQIIEQYTQPASGQYRTKQAWERHQTMNAATIERLQLAVHQIFGV